MKRSKFLFISLLLSAAFLPISTLAVFGSPGKYINSMDYGVKASQNANAEPMVIPTAEQINETYNVGKQNLSLPDAISKTIDLSQQSLEKNLMEQQISSVSAKFFSNPWAIFLSACILVAITFVLLKFKKVI